MSIHAKENWICFLTNSVHSVQHGAAHKRGTGGGGRGGKKKAGVFQPSSPSTSDTLMVQLRNKRGIWHLMGRNQIQEHSINYTKDKFKK